jgi:hypothetical protein
MIGPSPLPKDWRPLDNLRSTIRDTKSKPLHQIKLQPEQGEPYRVQVVDAGVLLSLLRAAEALVLELTPPPPRAS